MSLCLALDRKLVLYTMNCFSQQNLATLKYQFGTRTKGHHHILWDELPDEVKSQSDDFKSSVEWTQNYTVSIANGDDIKNKREFVVIVEG